MATSAPISISESAAMRVQALLLKQGKPGLKLRISVSGGGCSGFQYGFSLDDALGDDDIVIEDKGIAVLVDNTSLLYLAGSELDFVEELGGSSFQMKNPNASSSCGCGSSFAV